MGSWLVDFLMFLYFCLWFRSCLLPFIIYLVCEIFVNMDRNIIRSFAPFSYSIAGNHYDINYDELRDTSIHSTNEMNLTPMITIRVPVNFDSDFTYNANEQWHVVKNSSGRLHIGLIIEVEVLGEIVIRVDLLVTADSFFRFPIESAKKYLLDLAENDFTDIVLASDIEFHSRINGVRDISEEDGMIIVKTHWIRIVQRRWKILFAKKIRLRGGWKAQRNFEICGKYNISSKEELGLRGMLSRLN